MSKLYTKKGDCGFTCGMMGEATPKNAPFLDLMGAFDTCVCQLGVVRASVPVAKKNFEGVKYIKPIQETLQMLAGSVFQKRKLTEAELVGLLSLLKDMEAFIDAIPSPGSFVVPGETLTESLCHLARASARELERASYAEEFKDIFSDDVRAFFNRLSSFMFALSLAFKDR